MDKQAELNEFAEDVKSLSSREKAALVVVSLDQTGRLRFISI